MPEQILGTGKRMLKKITTLGAILALAAAGTLAFSAPAQAGEGRVSIGHGVKCYYYLGVQYCYKGV